MHQIRFDRLAAALAAAQDRRRAFAILAGVLLAPIHAGFTGTAGAQGICKGPGGRCTRKGQCCSGRCRRRKTGKGRCAQCPAGLTACPGSCADLLVDGGNCGACGLACPTVTCVGAVCACANSTECPPGCSCSGRVGGGTGCRKTGSCNVGAVTPCTGDDDCPFGSFCLSCGGDQLCSTPCPAQ